LKCSVIIPVLDDDQVLLDLLDDLQVIRQLGHELLVADGGGQRNISQTVLSRTDHYLFCETGRAQQMNHAAQTASGDILWFLHADTKLDAIKCLSAILQKLANSTGWGRFNVVLSGQKMSFRIIEWLMNRRSCLTGIATGDQGIFVSRSLFEQINGYAQIPLMEDINLSKRLKSLCKPVCLSLKIKTSSRRWEQQGIFKTVLLMWWLRLAYFGGVSPVKLAKLYR